VSTAIKWLEDMGYGVDGKFDLAAKRMWHGYEIKEILELYAAGFPQSGRTEPAEPTSGEPPQTWIEAWADKVLGKGNRPCGWPNFGSIGIKEVALMLEAYAAECVKRERERCAGIRDVRQKEVSEWCAAAFGAEHASSVPQRGLRMLEEAIEAYQSATLGLPAEEMRDKAHALVDYVFGRVSGNLAQECGGVGLTLLALCQAAGISAEAEELREIARVKSKPLEHFSKRNQQKNEAGFVVAAAIERGEG